MRKRNQLYLVVMVLLAMSVGAGGLMTGIESKLPFIFASPASGGTDQSAAGTHLDEAIKALQAGDTAGAEMHMTEADKALQQGEAKMHLDEAIKALQAGDTAGAETHAQMAQDSL
jgi:cellobiose-specific phosphotransferase system component IIA